MDTSTTTPYHTTMTYQLCYQIGRRSNTRSTSYTWTSVKALLDRNNLPYTIKIAGIFAETIVVFTSRQEAVDFRTKFERELRTIHRNIIYRCIITS